MRFSQIALALLAIGLSLFALASPPTPYRTLRHAEVVVQTDWFTCGAAAVATLLRVYYGRGEVGEKEVLALALRAMGLGEEEARPKGLTALALLRAMEALGLPGRGFRVSLEGLRDYFARGGLPLILHTTRPEPHYVVGVGMVGDQVVLDDPSWGRRLLPLQEFIPHKGFSGAVLVPTPSPEFIPLVRARQGAVLAWARGRLERLETLRGWP